MFIRKGWSFPSPGLVTSAADNISRIGSGFTGKGLGWRKENRFIGLHGISIRSESFYDGKAECKEIGKMTTMFYSGSWDGRYGLCSPQLADKCYAPADSSRSTLATSSYCNLTLYTFIS